MSDQELGANQNVTKHVPDPLTVWVSPLIISAVYVSWFEFRFSHECCWLKQRHLAALFTARKSHDCVYDGIKLSLSVRVSRWTQVAFGMYQATTIFVGEHHVMLMTFCSNGGKPMKIISLTQLISLPNQGWSALHCRLWNYILNLNLLVNFFSFSL